MTITHVEVHQLRQQRAQLAEPVVAPAPDWFLCQIDRKLLKQLMKRNDAAGLKNFGLWFSLLAVAGYLAFLFWGTWWAVPAFFAYGTLYASAEARAHELGHGTPFKTRWLNEWLYHICSFMALREAYYCRWRHAQHHTNTIVIDHDPEIQVTRPADLLKILLDFFHIIGGGVEVKNITLHALGILTPGAMSFMPESERRKMIWSSRAYWAIFLGFVTFAVSIGSFLPLMFVVTPRFYGAWFHQLSQLTQHAGLAENVDDHRLNTRTVYMNPVFEFLYFNMNFHIEHHMFPMVPCYALPQLHDAIKGQLPRTYDGILDVYREIVPALWRQSRDPSYFVTRTVPV